METTSWRLTALILVCVLGVAGCGTVQVSSKTYGTGVEQPPAKGNGGSQDTGNATASASVLIPGAEAPDVTLTLEPSGKQVQLASYIGKKPLIINAWASWCPPCQEETPHFVKLYADYKAEVQFLGVNLTSLDSIVDAEAFIRRYHIPYPVLFDTKGDFYRAYSVIAEPMTYVVSPSGKVVSIHVGALSSSALNQVVQQAIASR
ncbi:TlpA family protein disulfide reductase [Alicyclobacillus sendaiensis]|uniref:TlpA family protein disulfide reductase n=1 Tax=Alicyclobacillus sendaiensis TaxID=192387 RepID=UPI000B2F0558|nr:TlpA disulfide reductase family protein [Alicyclobacillus sendaiensis]